MKFYLSSKDIPALSESSFQERNEKVYRAQQKLTVPEKLILSILKLILLIPPFIYLARQDWLILLVTLVGSTAAFFCVFRPISLAFLSKHL
ncbi:MAG: hypothetical protein CL811_07425 [Colwelliaceae bacterium]|nr:hypothetical protein [Colwelliaceae bacterium]